jgi:hypothetical protein
LNWVEQSTDLEILPGLFPSSVPLTARALKTHTWVTEGYDKTTIPLPLLGSPKAEASAKIAII